MIALTCDIWGDSMVSVIPSLRSKTDDGFNGSEFVGLLLGLPPPTACCVEVLLGSLYEACIRCGQAACLPIGLPTLEALGSRHPCWECK